jgi:hypothetical protein
VPALYVFGDSTVDAGNNNNLNTDAKVNRFPYGIDFNNVSTGRFSNGKTFADILGKFKFCSPFIILGKTFALTVSLTPPRVVGRETVLCFGLKPASLHPA